MATNAIIWLKINPDDFGKTMKCRVPELPIKLLEYNYPCADVTFHPNPLNNELWAGIYCHHDGYRTGVGEELIRKFDTYEKVLNLILLGDISELLDNIVSYQNWRNEGCKIRFKQGDKPNTPKYMYGYYFEDDKWMHDKKEI